MSDGSSSPSALIPESTDDAGTIIFAVFREYAPEFFIKYKNKDELYQSLLKELEKHNIRLSELYWTDMSGDQIGIYDAERLLDVVNMKSKVHLTIRSADDCSNSSTVSSELDEEEVKNERVKCARSHSREGPRWGNRAVFEDCHQSCLRNRDRFCGHYCYNPTSPFFYDRYCMHPPLYLRPFFNSDPRFEFYPTFFADGCCHGERHGIMQSRFYCY